MPTSPHLAIFTDDPDRGGVAAYNHQVAMGARQRGFEVTMLQTRSAGAAFQEQKAAGIGHHWIPYDTSAEFVRTITDTETATRLFQTAKPDVVLFSDCCAVSNIAAKHVAISAHLPYLTINHNAAPYLAERFAQCLPVVGSQMAGATNVITVSTENLRLLRAHFGLAADRGLVIYPGATASFFAPPNAVKRRELRQRYRIDEDAIVSFTASRLDPMKGFLFQIRALELLRQQNPRSKIVCVWAGDGESLSAFNREIGQKRLGDRIKLVGRQSDIPGWLDASDIFTLTSLSEGMPICIMEAMAKKVPVISTNVGGVAEELADTGILLPDPNTHPKEVVIGLTQAWHDLESHPAKRQTLIEAAHQRALTEFQIEGMIDRVLTEVERISSSPAAV
ncbi:glycosyltransferase family 4 protein [Actomonas aquatica]|uniref:Glycosyltransferase family 4 protein n=1 Tax=Actomonas aquatica TaxID=2866162 RepID=A0ABZ1CCA8_9BACT|nr:glycosyltransferase family 4 protein [Opitutus sp. WL0086]WRQ89307.1 glycosyltransferase family 4 protein [Opitutus sp. WL0086]